MTTGRGYWLHPRSGQSGGLVVAQDCTESRPAYGRSTMAEWKWVLYMGELRGSWSDWSPFPMQSRLILQEYFSKCPPHYWVCNFAKHRKYGEFAASVGRSEAKRLSASGGFSWLLTRALPLYPTGDSAFKRTSLILSRATCSRQHSWLCSLLRYP